MLRNIPISKLVPSTRQRGQPLDLLRLRASILAFGVVEPLRVCAAAEGYRILDGGQRYCVLLQLGVEDVPCVVWTPLDK